MAELKKCTGCGKRKPFIGWLTLCSPCCDKYWEQQREREKWCQYCGDPAGHLRGKCDPCKEFHMEDWVKRGRDKRRANRLAKAFEGLPIAMTKEQKLWMFYTHGVVAKAIKSGLLPKLEGQIACVDCGQAAQQYDHRDYSRPLAVDPVCRRCNCKRGPGTVPEPRIFAAYVQLQAAA